MIRVFDRFPTDFQAQEFSHLETFCLASFVEFVTKLNETTFKPLYRRLFDWAFNDLSGMPCLHDTGVVLI